MRRICAFAAVAGCGTMLLSVLSFDGCDAFATPKPAFSSLFRQPSVLNENHQHWKHSLRLSAQSEPEITVNDSHDGEDDFYKDFDATSAYNTADNNVKFRQHRNDYGDLMIINEDASSVIAANQQGSEDKEKPPGKRPATEYGFLRPGTVVQIEVGDLSLARKAWKKRRRSGSPLLVPCSILNVDRLSMVRWNLLFLMEKFGRPTKERRSGGIEISLASLAKNYRTFLKSSLQRQVDALAFESSQEMMKSLFNKKVQESYGVVLEERTDEIRDQSMLYLTAPITRRMAQSRTANAPMMQFRLFREGDHGDSDTLTHTGYVRSRAESSSDEEAREYSYLPLSAALRVSQKEDLDSGRVVEGSILSVAVFDYDLIGDGGSPLLTLTIDPGTVRKNFKYKGDSKMDIMRQPKTLLDDLKMGDGPFTAKVVQMRKGGALVDFGVGRHVPGIEGTERVLATLRYKDSLEYSDDDRTLQKRDQGPWVEYDDEDDEETENLIAATIEDLDMLDDDEEDDDWDEYEEEDNADSDDDGVSENWDESVDALLALRQDEYVEDGEVEDDISHLFEVDTDGNLMYKDPDSGELSLLEEGDEMEELDEEDEDDDVDNDDLESDMAAIDDDDNDDDDNGFEGAYEDISDEQIFGLFVHNADGSMTYRDPDTGETMNVKEGDEEYQDMLTMKALIDDYLPKYESSERQHDDHRVPESQAQNVSKKRPRLQRKIIDVGDYVKVYVLDVATQSKLLRVTTNPLVKGLKPKDIKKEEGASKKLNRLRLQIGGNLNNVLSLKGRKVNGVVKAASKTGDWVYVQPLWKRDFPVGIGRLNGEGLQDISAGDYVECSFDGIDYDRGQLALQVLQKLDEETVSRMQGEQNSKPRSINVQSIARKAKTKKPSRKKPSRASSS